MSQCTTFNAHIADQVLQLSNVPRIASGSKNALVVHCTFCGKWAYDIESIVQFQLDMAMESEGCILDKEKVTNGVTAAMLDDSKGINER